MRRFVSKSLWCHRSEEHSVPTGGEGPIVIERLRGLDAEYLYLASPSRPLNICRVVGLDVSVRPDAHCLGSDAWPVTDEFPSGLAELVAASGTGPR